MIIFIFGVPWRIINAFMFPLKSSKHAIKIYVFMRMQICGGQRGAAASSTWHFICEKSLVFSKSVYIHIYGEIHEKKLKAYKKFNFHPFGLRLFAYARPPLKRQDRHGL